MSITTDLINDEPIHLHPSAARLGWSTLGEEDRKGESPAPSQVKAIRQCVQEAKDLGITAAQDWCADALHTSRRTFQQWEAGECAMHQAFYELLQLKTVRFTRGK